MFYLQALSFQVTPNALRFSTSVTMPYFHDTLLILQLIFNFLPLR